MHLFPLEQSFPRFSSVLPAMKRLVAKAIRERQPSAQLRILGILPRKEMEDRIRKINAALQNQLAEMSVTYIDLAPVLTKEKGRIDLSLFLDGLHPNEKGYERIADVLSAFL